MLPQEKLKELRKERGLTTYELGQLCGIHQSTISKLENGRRRLDIESLSKLAKALKVNVNEIIEEDLEDISFKKENLKDQFYDKCENIRRCSDINNKNDNFQLEGGENLSLKENSLENRINGEPVVRERDVTKEFNNIMGKFYSNEGGPLFFNGAELDGENMELFEQAIKVAIRTVKQRNKESRLKR